MAFLTFTGNLAPALLGAALSANLGPDLRTLLLWSVPLLYAASAAVFVVAGETTGGAYELRPQVSSLPERD